MAMSSSTTSYDPPCSSRNASAADPQVCTSPTRSSRPSKKASSSSAGGSSSTASTRKPAPSGVVLMGCSCAHPGGELGDPHRHLGACPGRGLDDEAVLVAVRRTEPLVDV